MTNWVTNEISISGPIETLTLFLNEKLNFQKFHPRPDDEECANWNIIHWGCKYEPETIEINREGNLIKATFDTAWMPPTTFLTYLTDFYTGVKIQNIYFDEICSFMGYSVSENGITCNEVINPFEYSFTSLREFANTNSWYDPTIYEAMIHLSNDCSGKKCDCLDEKDGASISTHIIVDIRRESYNEIIKRVSELDIATVVTIT